MKKQTVNERRQTYEELAKFNITRLIENAHKAGTTLPAEFVEQIDFMEVTKKRFFIQSSAATSYGDNQYYVDESLAVNLVSLLPFEAYKHYIDISWLDVSPSSDYGIAASALNGKKYDFLYYMLNYTHDYFMEHVKDKSEETRTLFNAYERKFLGNILDINHNVNNLNTVKATTEEIAQYFDLFKAALPKFNHFYHMSQNRVFVEEQPYKEIVNEKNWFRNYSTIKTMFMLSYKQEDFLQEMLENSKTFVIFENIFKQYGNYDELPLPKKDILQIAFDYGNNKLLKHICAYSNITEDDLRTAFHNSINKWKDKQMDIFNDTSSYKVLGQYSEYLKNIFDMMNKYYPDYKPYEYSALSNVLCVNNDKFVQQVIERFPELKTEKLYGLTVDQSHYAKQILGEFLQTHNLEFKKTNKDIDAPNYNMYYLNKIVQRMGPYKALTDEDKAYVHDHIAKYFLEDIKSTISDKELHARFLAFTLDKTLSNTTSHIPKVKI